jgi:hypothetical protein
MMLFTYINENIQRVKIEIKAGIIPCSVLRYWEIYARYDIYKKMGNSETLARFQTSEYFNVSEMTICRVIKKMESDVSINN